MGDTVEKLKSGSGKTIKDGGLKPSNIDKLNPDQRKWSNQVMRALGLQSKGSQGRVLAGAVSTAQVIEERNKGKTDKKSLDEVAEAKRLRAIVLAAGTPPWKDAAKAMAANDAKVQLDLLSLPEDQRSLKPLDPTKQGFHQAFWIDRQNPDDTGTHSYICKPSSAPSEEELDDLRKMGPLPKAPSGGPMGGEVAREALCGRAAQLLAAQTGIDIGMPETHVVSLDRDMVPGSDPEGPAKITCSVQEARHAPNDLRKLGNIQKSTIDSEQIANIAIFDTITLNTDRHGGNILVDPNGNLVPIDHGESLAEGNANGVKRIKAALGGPHNALLALPGAHAPMSKEMLKKALALNPDKLKKDLAKDNETISGQHQDMQGAISDGALENARRAAMFVKLAAKNKPPLSPAAIQVAMASAADDLFGAENEEGKFNVPSEKEFLAAAKKAIARTAPQQAAIKDVLTSSDSEYDTLVAQAEELGWHDLIAQREGEPDPSRISDPTILLTIIKKGITCPKRMDDIQAKIAELRNASPAEQITPQQAAEAIEDGRTATLKALMAIMPRPEARKINDRLFSLSSQSPENRSHSKMLMIEPAVATATEAQRARYNNFMAVNRVVDLRNAGIDAQTPSTNRALGVAPALDARKPLLAAEEIDACEKCAIRGDFLPESARRQGRALLGVADTYLVPEDDVDLKKGLAAAATSDPFGAKDAIEALKARAKQGEFGQKAANLLQAALKKFREDYVVADNAARIVDFDKAIQAGDLVAARAALDELRETARDSRLPPSEKGFRKMAADLGVPDQDPDFLAALEAVAKPDPAKAMECLKKLKKRAAANEFGDAALKNAQKAYDDLLEEYEVPANISDHGSIKECIRQKDAHGACLLLERLTQLAEAGYYPKKNG